jgi:predicted transcriptional regulator of viral defense system
MMVYIKVQDILEELQSHGKTVFTINDASILMKKPKKYVSKILSSNRKVNRIERGLYFISSLGNICIHTEKNTHS